ncbi:cupin domain-containing protein [Propionicimonas sp.]|uniref:cupin domain-containing protein n=1 Tax=Propionicimonas sp. TaxID=1955623 RepID=UPI0039E63D5A
MKIADNGPEPHVFDIEKATTGNANYRTVAWTGKYLQVTLMSIPPGSSIGLEKHPETDQFLRLDAGTGRALMGSNKRKLQSWEVRDGWSIQVPAGTWHDVENTGEEDLKLYVVYAPVHHTPGIVQKTSQDADRDEESGKDEPPDWSVQPAPDAEDKKA